MSTIWSNGRTVHGTNRNEALFNLLRSPQQRKAHVRFWRRLFAITHRTRRQRLKLDAKVTS